MLDQYNGIHNEQLLFFRLPKGHPPHSHRPFRGFAISALPRSLCYESSMIGLL